MRKRSDRRRKDTVVSEQTEGEADEPHSGKLWPIWVMKVRLSSGPIFHSFPSTVPVYTLPEITHTHFIRPGGHTGQRSKPPGQEDLSESNLSTNPAHSPSSSAVKDSGPCSFPINRCRPFCSRVFAASGPSRAGGGPFSLGEQIWIYSNCYLLMNSFIVIYAARMDKSGNSLL